MNVEDVKQKTSELWKKIGKYVIIGVSAILLIAGLVLGGQWIASGEARKVAQSLHDKFRLENQALYDNIAILQDRTDTLEKNYYKKKETLAADRVAGKGGVTRVYQSGDTKAIASFFDNLVDGYSPDK